MVGTRLQEADNRNDLFARARIPLAMWQSQWGATPCCEHCRQLRFSSSVLQHGLHLPGTAMQEHGAHAPSTH